MNTPPHDSSPGPSDEGGSFLAGRAGSQARWRRGYPDVGRRPLPRRKATSAWLVTYSDMITLLMAFFIALIAFSTPGLGRRTGRETTTSAGEDASRLSRTFDHNTVVWRLRCPPGPGLQTGASGASFCPDPSPALADSLLHVVSASSPEAMVGSQGARLSLPMLFDAENNLSPAGIHLLKDLAGHLRRAPCDLHFHVENPACLPRAVDLCTYLMTQEGMRPGRLAVGLHPPAEGAGEGIWLLLVGHY